MKISVITTTYNLENYIDDTIESVLSQKGNFYLEYIVYDALSTDATFEKIQKYKERVDSGLYSGCNLGIEMHVYQEKDNGMYDGLAKGFSKATGDIVAYINGDDFYFPNALQCVNDIFSQNMQIDWIMGNIAVCNQNGIITYADKFNNFSNKLLLKQPVYGKVLPFVQQESCFWRRSLLEQVDLDKFRTLKLAGDYYLWFNFAQKSQIYRVDAMLGCFRQRLGQQSEKMAQYFEELQLCFKLEPLSIREKFLIYYIKCLNNIGCKSNLFNNYILYNNITKNWQQKNSHSSILKINISLFYSCIRLMLFSFFLFPKIRKFCKRRRS